MSIQETSRETSGSEYQDPPIAPIVQRPINWMSLRIEAIARSWANQPARKRAPFTPGAKTFAGVLGFVLLGTAAQIINSNRGSTPVPDYLGSKAQSAQNTIDSLRGLPSPNLTVTPDDYSGSKDESQEFKTEGPRTGSRNNIFVTDLSDQANFTVSYHNLAQLIVDSKLTVPVSPNYIVSLTFVTQELPTQAERNALFDRIELNPGFRRAKADYYQSVRTPSERNRIIEIGLSVTEQIKALAPTSQEFHHLSTDELLFNLSYALSFTAFKNIQAAAALDNGKFDQKLTDQQIDALFSDQLQETMPIRITYIDPLLIQSIYQNSPGKD